MPASRLQDPRFEITIPRRLAPVLTQWFEAAGGRRSGTSLAIFLSEIVESFFAPIVEEELEKFLKLRFRPSLDRSSVFKQVKPAGNRKSRRKMTDQQIAEARLENRNGTKTTELMERYGCSRSTMLRHLKEV